MKLKIVFFSLIFLCSSSLFAKATTDLKLGGVYGYCPYDSSVKRNSLGFGIGCDVEITKHFGVFLDWDFLFPIDKEESYDFLSLFDDYSYGIKLLSHSLQGVEFIQYFNDKLKIRIGGPLGIEQKFFKIGNNDVSVTTFVGPGVKIDTTFLFNKYIGLNLGVESSFYFWGWYNSTSDYDNAGSINNFKEFNIIPSLSFVWHIGGEH